MLIAGKKVMGKCAMKYAAAMNPDSKATGRVDAFWPRRPWRPRLWPAPTRLPHLIEVDNGDRTSLVGCNR
jgi:hypothetical protein